MNISIQLIKTVPFISRSPTSERLPGGSGQYSPHFRIRPSAFANHTTRYSMFPRTFLSPSTTTEKSALPRLDPRILCESDSVDQLRSAKPYPTYFGSMNTFHQLLECSAKPCITPVPTHRLAILRTRVSLEVQFDRFLHEVYTKKTAGLAMLNPGPALSVC